MGSGDLFLHTSLKLLVIVVIFTEYGLTISFIPVALCISQKREELYLIKRQKSKSWIFSPYFSSILYVKESKRIFENI